MRNVLAVLAIVAMCGSIAQAGRTDISCSGTVTINASNAAWVGGHGWSSGSNRTISWSGSCNMCQWGIGIYGWGSGPLVEYYIGRSGGSNAGSYNTSKGGFTLYVNSCNGPNITGSGPFSQYNCSGSGGSGQNMGEHSGGWSGLGKGTNLGGGYQLVGGENYGGGNGTMTVSASGANWATVWWGSGSASINCGGGSTTTTSGGSTTTSGGGSKSIVVRAKGVTGQEQIQVSVNGNVITTWTLGTGMANWNTSTSASGSVNVCYTNDASGRDVQIDYVVLNGSTKQSESQSYNTGVYQNSKCGGSNSEWLHCNGCIGYGNI
ncbi:MAG: glycoside hydrolase family 11 protein [Sedimentisphaerales bacterium]